MFLGVAKKCGLLIHPHHGLMDAACETIALNLNEPPATWDWAVGEPHQVATWFNGHRFFPPRNNQPPPARNLPSTPRLPPAVAGQCPHWWGPGPCPRPRPWGRRASGRPWSATCPPPEVEWCPKRPHSRP